MKRLFMYLSAGIIILASASCKTDSGRKESSSVLVKTLTVGNKDSVEYVKYSGVINSEKEVTIAFKVNGQIAFLPENEGMSFRKGSIIATLDKHDEHYNLKPYVISYIDTMLFADKLGMPKKIKDLAESLDLEVTNHHDPEFDAKLCALIFGELTDKYPSYQELIRKIDDQPKTNNNYFNQPSEDVLEENEEHLSNYQITQNELENIDLIGKGIVITGNFSIEREEIKTFLMKIGGQIKSGITGKVDFVFAGEDCGWSKIQKINDLNQSKKANIRILNEADLNYLIKKYGI